MTKTKKHQRVFLQQMSRLWLRTFFSSERHWWIFFKGRKIIKCDFHFSSLSPHGGYKNMSECVRVSNMDIWHISAHKNEHRTWPINNGIVRAKFPHISLSLSRPGRRHPCVAARYNKRLHKNIFDINSRRLKNNKLWMSVSTIMETYQLGGVWERLFGWWIFWLELSFSVKG